MNSTGRSEKNRAAESRCACAQMTTSKPARALAARSARMYASLPRAARSTKVTLGGSGSIAPGMSRGTTTTSDTSGCEASAAISSRLYSAMPP